MSKTYKEICDEIGLDLVNMTPPLQKKLWYAYHDGKVITCTTRAEAQKYKLYETVLDPDTLGQIQDHWTKRNALEKQAAEIFKDNQRQEYSGMSDDLYNLCYKAAQDRSKSSSDYEEIPDNMKYFAMFAQKAINTAISQDNGTEQEEQEIALSSSDDNQEVQLSIEEDHQ